MISTIPADLLELKAHFETWRTNRKFVREPIPDELRQSAAEMTRRYPPSLVGRILKLDPSRLKRPATKSQRAHGNSRQLLSSSSSLKLHYQRSNPRHRTAQPVVAFSWNDRTVRG